MLHVGINDFLYPWLDLLNNSRRVCKNWLVIGYIFNDEFITEIFIEEIAKGGHVPRPSILSWLY
jgi:hypothetical protein